METTAPVKPHTPHQPRSFRSLDGIVGSAPAGLELQAERAMRRRGREARWESAPNAKADRHAARVGFGITALSKLYAPVLKKAGLA